MDPNDEPDEPWYSAGLRFTCTGCGKCCTGTSGSVYLSKFDRRRLAAFLKMPPGAFLKRYARKKLGRWALIDRPDSDECVFLRDKICTVYEARPVQCRTYPWWISNLEDAESWAEAATVCEGINHPTAQLIPASEIDEQCRLDIINESELRL